MLIRRIVSLAVALLAAATIAVTAAGAASASRMHYTARAAGNGPAVVRVLADGPVWKL